MKPVRRILVGIKDPEAPSLPAVDKAVQLAAAFGAQLTLFHAIAMPVAAEPYLYAKGGFRKHEHEVRQRHREALERLAARLRRRSRKLEVRVDVDWDFPVHEAIVRQARKSRADLVVAEAHAGRRLLPWLLHLTDWELLRSCPVPVLIVKSARRWRRPRLLAAIDPTHAYAKPTALDGEILAAGERFSEALGGSLHVMHVYMPVLPGAVAMLDAATQAVSEVLAANEALARRSFDKALRRSRVPRGRRYLIKGAAGVAIPRMAEKLDAGLVVMGAISRSTLKRIAIGNTAERVLGDLPCDVLVVKPKRFVTRVSRTRRGVRYVVSTEVPMPY